MAPKAWSTEEKSDKLMSSNFYVSDEWIKKMWYIYTQWNITQP